MWKNIPICRFGISIESWNNPLIVFRCPLLIGQEVLEWEGGECEVMPLPGGLTTSWDHGPVKICMGPSLLTYSPYLSGIVSMLFHIYGGFRCTCEVVFSRREILRLHSASSNQKPFPWKQAFTAPQSKWGYNYIVSSQERLLCAFLYKRNFFVICHQINFVAETNIDSIFAPRWLKKVEVASSDYFCLFKFTSSKHKLYAASNWCLIRNSFHSNVDKMWQVSGTETCWLASLTVRCSAMLLFHICL